MFCWHKKITAQHAAMQCDAKHDGKKKKNPHAKKKKKQKKKKLMEKKFLLTCRL